MTPTTYPTAARVEEAASVSVDECLTAADNVMAAMSRLQDRLSEAGLSEAVQDEAAQLYDFIQEEVVELQEQIIDEFERKHAAAPALDGSPK
ncbi:MAG TPA: hypothetical protein VH643_38130 [Gemmataceae bacterium]|jgi:cob(I)alamin adenosyltransferase